MPKTVKELRQELQALEDGGHADDPVIIYCMGGLSGQNAKVNSVSPGFDWESGQVVIQPEPALSFYSMLERERKKRRIWRIRNSSNTGSLILAREAKLVSLARAFKEVRNPKNLSYKDVTNDFPQYSLASILELMEKAPDGRAMVRNDGKTYQWVVVGVDKKKWEGQVYPIEE